MNGCKKLKLLNLDVILICGQDRLFIFFVVFIVTLQVKEGMMFPMSKKKYKNFNLSFT